MNEDLEMARADATKRALSALAEVVEDKGKSFNERLLAAEAIRGISQDLILGDLSSRGLDSDSSFRNKLLKTSVDKLDKSDNREL